MNIFKKNKNTFKRVLLILLCILSCYTLISCKKNKNDSDNNGNNPSVITPTEIKTEASEVVLEEGKSIKISYSVLPNGANQNVIWIVDDAKIATVEDGVITGISVGETTVSIIHATEDITKNIKVIVTHKVYNITYNLDGGTISDSAIKTFTTDTGVASFEEPTKEGHIFLGWYIDDELVDGISSGTNHDVTVTAKWQKLPTNLNIEEISKDLYVGLTHQLVVTSDKENEQYSYESLDESILTVSNTGLITCVGKGTTDIVVTSISNPNTKAEITIKVFGIPESFKTVNKTTELFIGSKVTIKLTGTPSGSLNTVTWESSNESVLTVDEKGTVIAISEGVATIKATSTINPNATFERTITVKVPATSVEVTSDKTSAYIGETINLSATVFPLTVSNEVTWTSNNDSIATVAENGVVTIIDRGEVTITAASVVSPSIKGKITITGLHQLLEEENSDVKYIICAPGTDASTSISINYHAKNTKTYIEYTLESDVNFENASSYYPNGVYFEELSEVLSAPFEARNVYSAEITGLIPGTKYIYRINKGDGTYSDTYHFTTASGAGNDFSFLWLTDNHYHYLQGEDTTGPEISEQTIKKAIEARPDLAFVFDTGDMIDTGGDANIWNIMFKKRETLKLLPLVSTTGNHELYINGTGQWDNRFHAAYNALLKNGVEGKVGTSCYYYYNDVLFITIENMSASSYDLQYEWIENLLKEARYEQKAKMVIIGMHGPIQADDNSDRDPKLMALFEKYSVDLVLTGHYHTDNETRNYFRGEISDNDLLGVNYLIGLSAGAKGVGSSDPATFAKGYIVDVIEAENKIRVTLIDANGKVYSVREYTSKKYEPVSEEAKNTSKEEIMDSFNYTLNNNTSVATFTWTKNVYGNVDKITFEEINRNEISEEVIIINQAFTDCLISNVINYYDSKFKISVYFNDGEVLTREITISRNTNYNPTLSIQDNNLYLSMNEPHSSLSNIIKTFKIYIDNTLYQSYEYDGFTNPIESILLENIDLSQDHVIMIVAEGTNKIIFSNSVDYTK